MPKALRLLALIVLFPIAAFAQTATTATPTQQSATHADAMATASATAAVNTAVTLTLTPGGNQYVYVCEIDFTISVDATGTSPATTNVSFTTTNLGGWSYKFSTAADVANTIVLDKAFTFPTCLKSLTPGTAVTIVSPAARTHAIYNINASYYFAL